MRIFVLLGQGGRATSQGMVALAKRLELLGETTIHSWKDNTVIAEINRSKDKLTVVGFSLGASALGYISHYATRDIELGVAYDPSRYSPLVKGGTQEAPRFKRLLCYYNAGAWFWGGARYVGPNVKLIQVNNFHLGIQFNEVLHLTTLGAVAAKAGL